MAQLVWAGVELVSHTTASGVTRTFESYGEHGWPTVVRQAGEIVDEPAYDLVGNRIRSRDLSDPTSSGIPGVVERSFDADRRVASLVLVDEHPTDSSVVDEETLLIARRHGGSLSVASEVGRGTVVTVELPAAVEEPHPGSGS